MNPVAATPSSVRSPAGAPSKLEPVRLKELADHARKEIHRIVHGQDEAIELLLIALAARGHVLMEGYPGVGKTTIAKAFAATTGLSYARVQLTPDLMPTDITGHSYFDQKTAEFKTRKGPVFTNLLLADEINRTPPRTQAALLEVMQEHQVTIEGKTFPVPDPFIVVATKNPIEVEGVYQLPEAELDRFLVSAQVGYPGRAVELALLTGKLSKQEHPRAVPELASVLQAGLPTVTVHQDIVNYLLDLVDATRNSEDLDLGASPRGAEHLLQASRARALLDGRNYAIPDDVKAMARPVLAHRMLLSADAEAQERTMDEVVANLLEGLRVPIEKGATRA